MVLSRLLHDIFSSLGIESDIVEWRVLFKERRVGKFLKTLNDDKPTLIISVGALADIFSAVIRGIKGGTHIRYISWLHCHPWPDLHWERPFWLALPYYILWRISFWGKHKIVCVSDDVVKNLPLEIRRRGVSVLNPVSDASAYVSVEVLRQEDGFKVALDWIDERRQNGNCILYSYGLLRKRKNFKQIVHALGRNPKLSLLIFGAGPEYQPLIQLGQFLQLGDRLKLLPFVNNPSRLCPWVDAYVSNTHSEGFGLANVEAALMGIPIILPAWPVNMEILEIFPNVRFYKPESDVSLDEELNNLVKFQNKNIFGANCSIERSIVNPYTKDKFQKDWIDGIIAPNANEFCHG
jgi:glycosyltransferase involved in cell wall biosynthesis